ncbi:hypothetical protein Dimus_012413 [Dionaea muscipula]
MTVHSRSSALSQTLLPQSHSRRPLKFSIANRRRLEPSGFSLGVLLLSPSRGSTCSQQPLKPEASTAVSSQQQPEAQSLPPLSLTNRSLIWNPTPLHPKA